MSSYLFKERSVVDKSDTEKPALVSSFIATWGEPMRVELGDFLVTQYPDANDGISRVERAVFDYSYEECR